MGHTVTSASRRRSRTSRPYKPSRERESRQKNPLPNPGSAPPDLPHLQTLSLSAPPLPVTCVSNLLLFFFFSALQKKEKKRVLLGKEQHEEKASVGSNFLLFLFLLLLLLLLLLLRTTPSIQYTLTRSHSKKKLGKPIGEERGGKGWK